MLAALLCNLNAGAAGRPRPEYTPDLDSKFLWVDDEYINVDLEAPKKEVVKKVVKAVKKISKKVAPKAEVQRIVQDIGDFSKSAGPLERAKQLKAYAEAVALLQEEMMRNEEEELIALLMLT